MDLRHLCRGAAPLLSASVEARGDPGGLDPGGVAEESEAMSDSERLEINWINSAGAALGAVSAAVVLSTLGTAGTLLGAALGSLCITIGGALYSHSLRMTKRRVATARDVAARRAARRDDTASARPPGQETPRTEPDVRTSALTTTQEQEALAGSSWKQTLRELPWKRIGLVSAALFVVTLVILVVFELSIGRSVASLTGGTDADSGTSVPGLGKGAGSDGSDPGKQPADDPQQPETSDQPPEEDQEDPAATLTPEEEASPPAAETTTEPTPTATATTSP